MFMSNNQNNNNEASQQLEQGADKLGIKLTSQQLTWFASYLDLLYRWHRLFNLTAVTPDKWVARHLLDSLSAHQFIPQAYNGKNCIDIGSGAGLPGIPLAIVMGSTTWYLLEKNTKKCGFLLRVKMELGLNNLNIINASTEKMASLLANIRELKSGKSSKHKPLPVDLNSIIKQVAFGSEIPAAFDLAIGRSVFGGDELLDYCRPLIKNGGMVLDMHGHYSGQPKSNSKWRVEQFSKIRVPYLPATRHIICWGKEADK